MIDPFEGILFPISKQSTVETMLRLSGIAFNVGVLRESISLYKMMIHLHENDNPENYLATIIVTETEWCYFTQSGHHTGEKL